MLNVHRTSQRAECVESITLWNRTTQSFKVTGQRRNRCVQKLIVLLITALQKIAKSTSWSFKFCVENMFCYDIEIIWWHGCCRVQCGCSVHYADCWSTLWITVGRTGLQITTSGFILNVNIFLTLFLKICVVLSRFSPELKSVAHFESEPAAFCRSLRLLYHKGKTGAGTKKVNRILQIVLLHLNSQIWWWCILRAWWKQGYSSRRLGECRPGEGGGPAVRGLGHLD